MQTTEDKRLDSILQMLLLMAQGNFTYKLELGDEKDVIASIMILMNILAEEMEARSPDTVAFPYSRIENNKPIMMFFLDGNGNIEGANEYGLLELNLEKEHIVGKPFMDLLTEESQKEWKKLDDQLPLINEHPETLVFLNFKVSNVMVLNKLCTVFNTGKGLPSIIGSFNSSHSLEEVWRKSWDARKSGIILPLNYNYEDILDIRKARDHIMANLDQEIPTVSELSSILRLSEYKLKNGFKEIYGTTIYAFAFQMRLRKAKALIKKSKIPIQNIILDNGFKSISHFYKMFKAKYGMTPSKMRKLHQNPSK